MRKYDYSYDSLNRLRHAAYSKPDSSYPLSGAYNETVAYDMNGNITTLGRNGHSDGDIAMEIDRLDYAYQPASPNRLASVTDMTLDGAGFSDGSTAGDDYGYDGNGNMISDLNKGITSITYNHLNLPVVINFPTWRGVSQKIEYLYDALGTKKKKTVTYAESVNFGSYDQRVNSIIYSPGGYQYKNGILEFFPTAEGYVRNTEGVLKHVFQYKDHLGNIRVSYAEDPALPGTLGIIEENHYYPFGLKHANYNIDQMVFARGNGDIILEPFPGGCLGCPNKPEPLWNNYKYNGKEYQDELGLNMTAMDYRQYDNAIARFSGMDRLAEMSHNLTPYRFGFNNPVYWNDPTGLLEQNSENLEHCPTCPNTPEFQPLIDDPNNTYIYDTETKQASVLLDEVVVSNNASTNNGLEILDFSFGFAGDYGKTLFENGSYKQTNGNTGNFNDRPVKRLSINAKATYNFAKNLKTLKKAGIVTTVVLGSIELSNGAIQDYKNYTTTGSTNLKNTAVAGVKVGTGIAVGWAAGAATGALIGTSIPIPIVGTLVGAIVGGVAGYYASEVAGNLVEKAYE